MKKTLSLALAILFVALFASAAFAGTPKDNVISITTEYYADGSYGVTTLTEIPSKATKTGSKTYDYYNGSNVLVWSVKLTATFNYTGTTSSCTGATPSYTVYNTAWKVTKSIASYSGSTATGEYTAKRYVVGIPVETVNKTLTITCSPSGVLS